MQPAKPNAPHSSLTNRIHIDRLTSKRNRKTRYHGPGPLATLFQGPKLCRRFVRSLVVLSVLSVQHPLFLFFLAHQIRPKTSTQRHNQHVTWQDIRGSTSAPLVPRSHTHTPHRSGAGTCKGAHLVHGQCRHNRRGDGSLRWALRFPEGTRGGSHLRD